MSEREVMIPVDTTGSPVIIQCPVDGCTDLDLFVMECAPGYSWTVSCGAGHWSWVWKEGPPS